MSVHPLAVVLMAAFHEARLARMERMAMTDELTGLPNRRLWDEQLPRELARADRHQFSLFVAMLDLDRFKAFNDTGGHQAGDRLLKAAAAAWRSALRPYDILARYGGEEFGLMLAGCSADEARDVVERLRATTPDAVTCSAGVAAWMRPDGVADAASSGMPHSGAMRHPCVLAPLALRPPQAHAPNEIGTDSAGFCVARCATGAPPSARLGGCSPVRSRCWRRRSAECVANRARPRKLSAAPARARSAGRRRRESASQGSTT